MHQNLRRKPALFCELDHSTGGEAATQAFSPDINQLLTKLVYEDVGHLGARVLACRPAFSVGVGQ
jgi:hypothetical protein